MNFLYDILLNFTDSNLYEYFDWNNNDYIINNKKLPLFRVDYKTIYDFCNYKIKIDQSFLKHLSNNSYNKKLNIDYIFVLSNTDKSIGIGVDKKGNVLYRSCLSYEDEDYANKLVNSLNTSSFSYKIINRKSNKYVLRDEVIKKEILIKEFKKRYYLKNYDVLKYYYLEVFDKECDNIKEVYNSLIKGVDSFLDSYDKVFSLIRNNQSLFEK